MGYAENKANARTQNTDPTATDQSQAKDTDINVIVRRFTGTGTVPGTRAEPMYIDTTQLPDNLRNFIETANDLEHRRARLPQQLREMPIEELVMLTPDKLNNILNPPAQPAKEIPRPGEEKETPK